MMSKKTPISVQTTSKGRTVNTYECSSGHKEFYADGIHGIGVTKNVFKFNFVSDILGRDTNIQNREIVCTMVLPLNQLRSLADILTKIADDQKIKSEGKPIIKKNKPNKS